MGLQLSQCHSPFHGDVAVPRKILLGHRLDPATIESLECRKEGVGVIKESFWPGNEIQKHDNTAHVLNAAQLEARNRKRAQAARLARSFDRSAHSRVQAFLSGPPPDLH